MPTLHTTCPYCSREAKPRNEFIMFSKQWLMLQCGHMLEKSLVVPEETKPAPVTEIAPATEWRKPEIDESFWSVVSVPKYYCKECREEHTRFHAYHFQREGVMFAERAQLRAGIFDEMGLGKTVQGLLAIKRSSKMAHPTLIVVKSATILNWVREYKTWVSSALQSCFPITRREFMVPGFDSYVISMDMLSRKGVLEALNNLGIKSIIIDEVQSFKDTSSLRTKALVKFITDNSIQYILPLSGTPFKNRLSEFYPVLNMLDPVRFSSEAYFRQRWLVQNEQGQYTRINPIYLEDFKQVTSQYVIRREKKDVLPDLPALIRDYQFMEITDENIKKAYNSQLDLFSNFLKSAQVNDERINSTVLLGWLAKLRAITGKAKCSYAVEWIKEFLDSTDDSLAVGVHHQDVRDMLHFVFTQAKLNPLKLSGEDSAYRKDAIAQKFNAGSNRLLVLQSLAGGVGLNLQSCANLLVLEREWNSADEEQLEGRFHRNGQTKGVIVTYLIAKGTIDEFFHNKVQEKRSILAETGYGNEDLTGDLESLKAFAEFVVSQRL